MATPPIDDAIDHLVWLVSEGLTPLDAAEGYNLKIKRPTWPRVFRGIWEALEKIRQPDKIESVSRPKPLEKGLPLLKKEVKPKPRYIAKPVAKAKEKAKAYDKVDTTALVEAAINSGTVKVTKLPRGFAVEPSYASGKGGLWG